MFSLPPLPVITQRTAPSALRNANPSLLGLSPVPAGPGLQDEVALSLWPSDTARLFSPHPLPALPLLRTRVSGSQALFHKVYFYAVAGAAAGGLWEAGYHLLPTVLYLHHT